MVHQLGCVHTNRVESSPIQSSQTLESRGVHTDRVESNQVCVSPSGFLVLFEQRASKKSKAMENILVLHMIMWRRRWRRKRRNMWVHPINIKRPEFGIFSHLYPYLLENEEKFHGVFRVNIEQFYSLSQVVGEEIRKQNTNYRRAISPEERLAIFLRYVLQKSVGDKKRFSIILELHFF